MKDAHRIAAFRQLCCLGVGAQASMATLLRATRELVPSDSAGFFWVNTAGEMTQLYAERVLPQSASQLFFERYHDGAAQSFTTQFRERVAKAESVSAFVPDAATQRSEYYNTILRSLDAHYILHGVVRDAGAALGQVSLYRNKAGKTFSAAERQRLADIVHYFAHALARPSQPTSDYVETDDEGVVIIDSQGAVQHAAGQSRRLLQMATNPQASAQAPLGAGMAQAVLQDLVRRLEGAVANAGHAAPPKRRLPCKSVGKSRWCCVWLRGYANSTYRRSCSKWRCLSRRGKPTAKSPPVPT
jgi:hypothetical protein